MKINSKVVSIPRTRYVFAGHFLKSVCSNPCDRSDLVRAFPIWSQFAVLRIFVAAYYLAQNEIADLELPWVNSSVVALGKCLLLLRQPHNSPFPFGFDQIQRFGHGQVIIP